MNSDAIGMKWRLLISNSNNVNYFVWIQISLPSQINRTVMLCTIQQIVFCKIRERTHYYWSVEWDGKLFICCSLFYALNWVDFEVDFHVWYLLFCGEFCFEEIKIPPSCWESWFFAASSQLQSMSPQGHQSNLSFDICLVIWLVCVCLTYELHWLISVVI